MGTTELLSMNLEDHIGDIIRKGRTLSNVSVAQAARAAEISEAELATLEEAGRIARTLNYVELGKLLSLDGLKLERIAKGWTPIEPDLSLWSGFKMFTSESEGLAVNCYLIWDEVSREAALFDTGWAAGPILKQIEEEHLQLRHLFITHSHPDHIAAVDGIRQAFPKIRMHRGSKQAPVDQRNRTTDFIHLGSLRITNRETPGHAEDGTTYVIGTWPDDAPHVAVVGDAIFAGSIGRGNQSWELARQAVRNQILSLPEETLICPGHGPLTTVAQEKGHNPFF